MRVRWWHFQHARSQKISLKHPLNKKLLEDVLLWNEHINQDRGSMDTGNGSSNAGERQREFSGNSQGKGKSQNDSYTLEDNGPVWSNVPQAINM